MEGTAVDHDQVQAAVPEHLSGTSRTMTVNGDTERTMTLRRHYDADVADVWQACTDPERLARWLTPVSGDLRPGGRFQLTGNASGQILRCEPPRRLEVTWESPGGQPVTRVTAELAAAGGGTDFELRHSGPVDPQFWAQFGPGAVGVGWDLGLFGLALHLAGLARPEQVAGPPSASYRDLVTGSSAAWQAAAEAGGTEPEQAKAAADRTAAFYLPPGDPAFCRTRAR
jgi:uncharacterized protein YndB with AHSA1/START domain